MTIAKPKRSQNRQLPARSGLGLAALGSTFVRAFDRKQFATCAAGTGIVPRFVEELSYPHHTMFQTFVHHPPLGARGAVRILEPSQKRDHCVVTNGVRPADETEWGSNHNI